MPYDNDATFTLGQNDKGDNPKRPDYRGKMVLHGRTYRLSAWKRTRQSDGSVFLSGKIEEERGQGPNSAQNDRGSSPNRAENDGFAPIPPRKPANQPPPTSDLDEDVPF